ncbi:MAG: nucleoside hydrolase [Candidatus Thorarchaeota archaeon]|jgi:purine nucleosidase
MRHFLIDTDTASDDAIALLMALREPAVRIEAITVVVGNCSLEIGVRNALISIEKAGTYTPPVYSGMSQPLLREPVTAEYVHGQDGLGNMNLPPPAIEKQSGHAIDVIIEMARRFPGELEIITLGPLTNLAMAILKEPKLPDLIKRVYIMGGAGLGPGNISPVAEFNFYVDAEAAHLVIQSKLAKTVIGWDVCMTDGFLNQSDISHLKSLGPLGEFAVRASVLLIEFTKGLGRDGFGPADQTAVAVALYPDLVTKQFDTYGYVEHKSEKAYGQFILDQFQLSEKPHNVTAVTEIDGKQFKEKMFQLLS